MSDDDMLRELHRIIDARITLQVGTVPQLELVRGTVTAVSANQRTLAATLDGAAVPTPGIVYGAGHSPVVGDDIVVLRRRDGLLLLDEVLGRD